MADNILAMSVQARGGERPEGFVPNGIRDKVESATFSGIAA